MSEFILAKPGHWDGAARPLFLAPMSGVTDLPYRLLAKECGADFTITEFTNSTALTRDAAMSWRKMETCADENPFIPQIFGGVSEDMALAAELLQDSADIIDLNFGCPAPKITKICAGAALMGEPQNLVSMCEEVVDRIKIPVTAKTRIGFDDTEDFDYLNKFILKMKNAGCKTFILHARKAILKGFTPKQNLNIPKLNYEMVYKIKQENPDLEIIINGGISNTKEIKNHLNKCNGVMIGRAIYQNPFFLVDIEREIFNVKNNPTREEIVEQLLKYLEKEVKLGTKVNHVMRHAVGLYHGQPGSKNWKRYLSDNMMARDSDFQKAKHIMTIVQNNEKANQIIS